MDDDDAGRLLLWSLALPENNQLAHHIGLGKPLGLGSVKIKVKQVQFIDRKRRYEKMLELGIAAQPETLPESQRLAGAIDRFRDQVKEQNKVSEFNQAPNVADLLVILDTRQPAAAAGAGAVLARGSRSSTAPYPSESTARPTMIFSRLVIGENA